MSRPPRSFAVRVLSRGIAALDLSRLVDESVLLVLLVGAMVGLAHGGPL